MGKRERARSNRRESYNKNKNKSPRTHQQKKSPEMKTFRSSTMMREVNALGHHSSPTVWGGGVRWEERWVLVGVPKFGSSYPLPAHPSPLHPPPLLLSWSSSARLHTQSACRKEERGWDPGDGALGDGW